jgi:cell division protease FtsH
MYLSKTKMKEEISTLLAGRVAESLVLGEISTGAFNDLERATDTAYSMITKYGMNEDVGTIVCDTSRKNFIESDRIYSNELISKIDNEVKKLISERYSHAKSILEENIRILHKVAENLIAKEKLSGDEFRKIVAESV